MKLVTIEDGDILQSQCTALVNPINCVGVMGAGLAKEFRESFPTMFRLYGEACSRGEVEIGRMFVYEQPDGGFLIGFPTKKHWANGSHTDYIRAGLDNLVEVIKELNLDSIAIPKLGCGLGGLSWTHVFPMIIGALEPLDIYVEIYI